MTRATVNAVLVPSLAAALGLAASTAQAGFPGPDGPNAGGALVLAAAPGVVFTTDEESYCGAIGLDHCSDAVTRTDSPEPIVLAVLGAFNEMTSPRVTGVTFGWDYDDTRVSIVGFGSCGDFELATADWPAPGEGTAVTFVETQLTPLVEFYWAAAYDYYAAPAMLQLTEHPSQGASFSDDSIPAILDEIVNLGAFGFFTDGYLPCPPNTLAGGCCFEDLSCQILDEPDCLDAGGQFQGWGTNCDEPCHWNQSGVCCLPDGECVYVFPSDACESELGGYFLEGEVCDPNPCVPTPTEDNSWGGVKSRFRE
ncbi:MAG: hypothetical protein H6682_11030 [Candidatus Eisenbacteria bacterium]|nr:hypothetical protein [Candidatus Eisenbacteria bacterium]